MRCPVCGYDFNKAVLEIGFHKCDYHPDIDMIYICDGCKKYLKWKFEKGK